MEKKLTKAENLKKSNNFIDRLEKVKSFLILKLEITLKENSKIHRILNRIITKRNKYFNDIEKRTFYKFIEEGNTNIERCKIYDGEMIENFSKIEKLLYEIVDIHEKIEIV
mgnify:CR=1 FL=1